MIKTLVRALALGLPLALTLAWASPAPLAATRKLVIVTLEGVRVQELFGGLGLELLRRASSGPLEQSEAYRKYWAPTREEPRALDAVPVGHAAARAWVDRGRRALPEPAGQRAPLLVPGLLRAADR